MCVCTLDVVRPVTEAQGEDVVDGSAGVQCVGALVVADVAVLPFEDQHRSVDQLQVELLVLAWPQEGGRGKESASESAIGYGHGS